MASTYSELKIELMADGEKTGQWGGITNVNLGTAIEEAITGSSNVEFSGANVTLTLVDSNDSQSARNLRLNLTGSTGAARDLIVPAIEKVYIVNNGCAHTVTVKNSTGTGIAVPAGKTMYVYNDGTNVVDAITHLTSLTLGTPLPVASGGTGDSTASGARTNLGLGTIATQNANSVNIDGGTITGITDLALADGGTGASTASNARTNLGLGTVATQNANSVNIDGGTIDGVTLSATSVNIDGGTIDGVTIGGASAGAGSFTTITGSDDLNIDSGTLFVDASTNNVGVGTGGPTEKLHVIGNILASGDITAFSDIRLKTGIEVIPSAVDKVNSLSGYTYTRKDTGKKQTGVIAQEVQKVLPEAVNENADGMLSVAYGNLAGLLIEAIKEQQTTIRCLVDRIETIEGK